MNDDLLPKLACVELRYDYFPETIRPSRIRAWDGLAMAEVNKLPEYFA
jgi:hypothetical protein